MRREPDQVPRRREDIVLAAFDLLADVLTTQIYVDDIGARACLATAGDVCCYPRWN